MLKPLKIIKVGKKITQETKNPGLKTQKNQRMKIKEEKKNILAFTNSLTLDLLKLIY